MSDAPLPTGQALAARLFELGLAPPGCEEVAIYGTPRYYYRWHETEWQPWHRIEHCWHLMDLMKLSLDYRPARPRADGSVCPASWWVGEQGVTGVIVPTFEELPTAICHAVLKVQAWRNG